MDEILTSEVPSEARRRQTKAVRAALALTPCALFALASNIGCTAAQQASVAAATHAVVADAQSPAGQAILADVSSAALNAGLDVATGNDTGAIVAGIQGAASAMRDYEGLPTAPSAATIAQAAAAGSGVAQVAATLAPSLQTIIGNASQSASTSGVSLSIDAITEAAARGLDAVAAAKYVPPTQS
jgi:hypothetical protein